MNRNQLQIDRLIKSQLQIFALRSQHPEYTSIAMTLSEKSYYQIVKALEKENKSLSTLSSEEDAKKVFLSLMEKIKTIFKLNITFDSAISRAILKRLETEYQHYYYEESFVKTLNFLKAFTVLLRKEKFISQRDQLKIKDKIRSFEDDPCFKYYNMLCYLRGDSDRKNFRLDFLFRYMGMNIDDDEEEYQDWQDDDYKQVYRKFWKYLMSLDPKPRLVTYIYSCFCKYEDPNQMLTDQLIEKINQKVGQNVGKTDIEVQLNNQMRILAIQNFYETSSEARDRINKEYEIIETFLHKFQATKKIEEEKLELHVSKFGSLVSGFAGTDTDLDITILTNSYVNQNNFLLYLAEFLKIQFAQHDKKTGRTTKVQKIDAKTPLVQVQIQGDRREGKFKIDILVNNLLGVINSRFLSIYAQVPWIKQLGILFKLWSKTSEIISKQLLSSYSMILMMINFLIKKNYVNLIYNAKKINQNTPRINFRRQRSNFQKSDEFQVFFEFDNRVQNVTRLKTVNLAQIMKELFLYYSEDGEHWKINDGKNIISVDGTYDKDFDEECIFTIKDPFDKPHNPGRAKIVNKKFLLDQLKSGFIAINELQKKTKKEERVNFLSSVFQRS